MREDYRMENPKKEFRKILHTKLGKESHEYFGFPGEYNGPEPCEKPDTDRELPPAYLNYYISTEKWGNMMNSIYYEDSKIDEEYLEKIYHLGINFSVPYHRIPTSTIITKLPLSECVKRFEWGAVTFLPTIFTFADYDSDEHILKIKEKIEKNEEFENVEALDLLFIVENCKNDQLDALNTVCRLFHQMKIKDEIFKDNLKEAVRCIIHEYAVDTFQIKILEQKLD